MQENICEKEKNQKIEDPKCADIIEFKHNITQFELTKIIYESAIFEKIQLTPTTKLFLWALCTHFNPDNEDMFPSQSTVAKRLGISEKSAERAVKELKGEGIIEYKTKRVNHYRFSEKFFALVKMSVMIRQNVGSESRQNVGLTNKYEQKKNKAKFLFKEDAGGVKRYVRYDYSLDSEKSGSRAVPSIEETQELLKKYDAQKSDFNPWKYTKKEAKKWLDSLNSLWLQRSKLAKFLIKKYEFKEFYNTAFGKEGPQSCSYEELGVKNLDELLK